MGNSPTKCPCVASSFNNVDRVVTSGLESKGVFASVCKLCFERFSKLENIIFGVAGNV